MSLRCRSYATEGRKFITPGKRGKGKYDSVGIVLGKFFNATPDFEKSLVSKESRPNGWVLRGSWPSSGKQVFDWELEAWGDRGGEVIVKLNMWSNAGRQDGNTFRTTVATVDRLAPKFVWKYYNPIKEAMKKEAGVKLGTMDYKISEVIKLRLELLGSSQVEGINDPFIFKALFTAGGPGSGKSYVARHVVEGLGLKMINSDINFERILKKQGVTMKIADPETELGRVQQTVRERAKEIEKKQQSLYVEGMLGIVVDGTGKDFTKITKNANSLKDIGYDVGMIFVNTSLDTAMERNRNRARSVPEELVKQMWSQVQDNIGKFQQFFGPSNFMIVDSNDTKEGTDEKMFGMALRRIGLKWLKQPIQNPIGRNIVASLRSRGGKTRSDL